MHFRHTFEGFIFDIGNVLIKASRQEILQELADLSGLSPLQLSTQLIDSGLTWKFECGKLNCDEFAEELRKISLPQKKFWSNDDFYLALCRPLKAINESLSTLFELTNSGASVAFASNTNKIHWDAIKQILQSKGLSPNIPAALSFELGAYKPDPRLFECAARLVGNIPRSKCLFVDDNPNYVDAAAELGFAATCFTGQQTLAEIIRQAEKQFK